MGGSLTQHKKPGGLSNSPRQKKSSISDSEGNFETPEAETPVHGPLSDLGELDNSSAKRAALLEVDEQLISKTAEHTNTYLDKNSNQNEIITLASKIPAADESTPAGKEIIDELNNVTVVAKNLADLQISEDIRQHNLKVDSKLTRPHSVTADSDMLDEPMVVSTEESNNDRGEETSLDPQVKAKKTRPPSLDMKGVLDLPDPAEVEDEIPVPKATNNFNPEDYDSSSKLQNSSDEAPVEPVKAVKMEFGLTDNGENGEVKKPPPRKLGKKGSRLTPKKQKPKPTETGTDPAPEAQNLDDMPIPTSSYTFDPSKWDDPNFNPFSGSANMGSSPVLPKGSYKFDPDSFDDTVDPFKPSKGLPIDLSKDTHGADKLIEDMETQNLDLPLEAEEKGRQSPKKNKSRLITGACKVKKYENQSLVLDICGQEDEPVVSEVPDIANRVGHATDEEKWASTASTQKPGKPEMKGDQDDEFFECSNVPNSTVSKKPTSDGPAIGLTDNLENKDSCSAYDDPAITKSTKVTGSEGQGTGSPVLDTICISEADKAAVLTLIREEIITKEIEANEWKRKYDESRQEVIEMRKIVAEYEKTIAQMIEDEQRTNMTSQKTMQQLTLEKDQALADLNSVERSLSDLFRRYENMKGVLEGFKKNEEMLKKCAQEYLARVKQEEQRYQTLKIHAEEKLDKANEEIAQVRSKANSESVALHAGLRKEQMKVESLERALQQKNQEIEELTKICDELIAKLGKTD
ncbi:transforming acidic coiled-coil-containing protein 1 isoform X2 [Amia ocellicauda]|uniref:transforming acidic coiled-coil-containing protein 1 isoform X2 n=1 Tax=Amia ocellicauda TaxID=2972642 RepID=UPI0034644E3D